MVQAIGYSVDAFDPMDPGRLCRGRERWIESFPLEDDAGLYRTVISGAEFSDDSARDAMRGLTYSGLALGQIIAGLFADQRVLAWCEDGHPDRVPEAADQREDYEVRRPHGPLRLWRVRWAMSCESAEDIQTATDAGADVLTVLHADTDLLAPHAEAGVLFEAIRRGVFLLGGHRQDGSPVRRFQATALPELLALVQAVVLVHRDKHGPCLGVYTGEALDPGPVLGGMTTDSPVLSVPFAIPPMLARWDRALWELRQDWNVDDAGPFPVPAATDRSPSWLKRHGARSRAEE